FIQGLSLSMLFVPLTTITMAPIPREQMGNATSLFNLMRNLGGSFGIATVTTMVARYQQSFTNILGAHVTPYSTKSWSVLSALRGGMAAHGSDPATAARQGYQALFGVIERQASILSFVTVFQILAAIFLAMVPLVLLMKRPPRGAAAGAAH